MAPATMTQHRPASTVPLVGEDCGPVRRLAAVGGTAAALAVAIVWGGLVVRRDPSIQVSAAPFVGSWHAPRLDVEHLGPVAVACVVVAIGPALARRLRWSRVVVLTSVSSALWALSLAASDGWRRVAEPLTTRYEYLAAVGRVGSPAGFLRSFVAELPTYPTHVKGHPPGMVLVLWCLDRIGLGGAGWATAVVLAAAGLGAGAVLVAVGAVAGRGRARSLAPFLVLSPAAVWVATSADAFFVGVGAIAVATAVVAVSREGRSGRRLAVAAGAGFAAVALLSYGLVLLGLIPLGLAIVRRRLDVLLVVATTAAVVLVTIGVVWGFWWPDGLAATRMLQLAGVAPRRPAAYFLVANLVVAAVCVGPAVMASSTSWRKLPQGALALVGGALTAIAVADLSGFSKGEVERIWLPFYPWLTVAALALPGVHRRWWLGAGAVTGLGVQLVLRSPW